MADLINIDSPIFFRYGIKAEEEFKKGFSNKQLYADAKIADKVYLAAMLFSQEGATSFY